MRVLIVYASRCGSTQGIAERIGRKLGQEGIQTDVKKVEDAGDPAAYDAVVIGSAAYYFHWMKPATEFVRRNCSVLAERPVWLFSSGPLGTKLTDDQGRDVRTTTVPKEIAEFDAIHPLDHRVFFGALDPRKLGFLHRIMFHLPANHDGALFPAGDFRDWSEIDAWAGTIADELKAYRRMHATVEEEALV